MIQERRLLEEIDHPFVCNMRYAFQDDEHLFMILDLMLGGDIRFHLDRLGKFPEEVVKFYVAELALALDYLHSKGIVHRYIRFVLLISFSIIFLLFKRSNIYFSLCVYHYSDIKPDNILLDERGHAHLTDFNIAVHASKKKLLTSVTGSLAYMGMWKLCILNIRST